MTFSNTETQGIFLHIECVPFWDAVPFHWDAAAPNFRSLRPKRKMLLIHIKIKLKINEIMQKNKQLIRHRAWFCRALRPVLHCPAPPPVPLCLTCPIPCLTYRSASPCPVLNCLTWPYFALPCPAVLCSALPFRATSFHTLPCSVLPCPALRCIA